MVQNPTTRLEVYTVVTVPAAPVVPALELRVPQGGVPLSVNVTASPDTAVAPVASPVMTVAVTVVVLAPSAGVENGLGVRAIVFGAFVCVMTVDPFKPPFDSVTVTVQMPVVTEDV
jgi:hypothetical protein